MVDDLKMREEKIYSLVVSRMMDKDGLVYSMILEDGYKPIRDKDIPDKICFNYVDAPKKLWKAGFFGYEDSLMATAEFLLANIYKYQATNDKQVKQLAKKLFGALKLAALAGAKYTGWVVKPMFGFLPKPYGGIKTAHLSGEVSVDQYQRVMYALEVYRDTIASASERKWIDKFLLACADCWDVNNYTFNYMLGICRWGCCSAHSVAFGLYCSAIGMNLSDKRQHKGWFDIFMSRLEPLERKPTYSLSDNVACLVAFACKSLCCTIPKESNRWITYAERICNSSVSGMDEDGYGWLFTFLSGQKKGELIKPHWDKTPHRYWNFLRWRGNIRRPLSQLAGALIDVYELSGNKKYLGLAKKVLGLHGKNGYVKWIEPVSARDLPKGYEVLGRFISGLNSACWLRAYWQMRMMEKNSLGIN